MWLLKKLHLEVSFGLPLKDSKRLGRRASGKWRNLTQPILATSLSDLELYESREAPYNPYYLAVGWQLLSGWGNGVVALGSSFEHWLKAVVL